MKTSALIIMNCNQLGAFEEVMLITGDDDLAEFMHMYGIDGKIDKIY